MKSHALCIAHSNHNRLGRFPSTLEEQGWHFERANFLSGERPEQDADGYDAIIVFGGVDSLVDGLGIEYKDEFRFIERCIAISTPIVGICLGGQILSEIYGGTAPSRRANVPEIGFRKIQQTEAAPKGFWSHRSFFQWHWDDMPCPSEAKVLGSTDEFECQAFMIDNSLALQFHPDATSESISAWVDLGSKTIEIHSSKTKAQHVQEAIDNEAEVQRWTANLVSSWLKRKA